MPRQKNRGLLIFMGILLVICISLFGFSINLHRMVMETLERSDVSGAFTEKLLDEAFSELGVDDQGLLSDMRDYMKDSDELREIADKVMKEMILSLEKGTSFEEQDFSKELTGLIGGLSQALGDSDSVLLDALKNQLIKELRSKQDVIETLVNTYASEILSRMQNMSGTAGLVIDGYVLLQSLWFQWAIAAAVVVLAALTLALSGRFSRASLYLGMETLISSGLLVFVIRPAGSAMIRQVSERFLGTELEFYAQPLTTTAQIMDVAGAVFLIIGLIGALRLRKRS